MQRLRLAAVLTVLSVVPIARASAGPSGAHPHFDDAGTLSWSSSLKSAQAAARAQGKLIFVESGRLQCRNCRILVQRVLPTPCIRDRMSSLCVGLAADCDAPDPQVSALFDRNLPNASVLPLVGFVTADLQWVTGWCGGTTAESVATHLKKAETYAKSLQKAAPCTAPKPPATLASAPTPAPATAPASADVEKAHANLEKARRAAATGQWGEVMRLEAEVAKLPLRVDVAEWKALVGKAKAWCEENLAAALAAAQEGRAEEAAGLLEKVRKETPGASPAADDASKGERALARLRDVVAAGEGDAAEEARKAAQAEFRDTRWAVLFQG